MKQPRVLLLNLSGIGFRSTSKMAVQSYSKASINKSVSGFFDILIGYQKPKDKATSQGRAKPRA